MNKTYLLALAAALVAAPAALAHDPPGTLKNYCEDPSEWGVHDYGPPGTGFVIFLGQDGNIAGDCNGDTIPADYDGHIEFAFGGGWLSADSGDGVTTGSIFCFGEVAHHAPFGLVEVVDNVLGTGTTPFSIASDTVSLVPPTGTENCGDFESDNSADFVGSGAPTFPPGLDGTYQVYVGGATGGSAQVVGLVGTAGHITTAASLCIDVPNTFSILITGVGPVPKIAGCNEIQVTGGPVTLNFNDGSICTVVATGTCPWGAATSFTINPIALVAAGTWQQLP